MLVTTDIKSFNRQMQNIVDYSFGFIDGIELGKSTFLNNIGRPTIQALYDYVDANARLDQTALHHIYEWYKTGSPNARLFELDYSINTTGISINATFRQSLTTSNSSKEPFYDKARIMEKGIPVTIFPKNKDSLSFNINGEIIFSKGEITVENPGGKNTQGAFEKVFSEFINRYFKQSFLRASGIYDYLSNPIDYKVNIFYGSKYGRSAGQRSGYKWISNVKVGLE